MNPILESLRAAVPRLDPVLAICPFTGSYRDWSPEGNHGTPASGRMTRSNGVLGFQDGTIDVAADSSLELGDMTIFVGFSDKMRSQASSEYFTQATGSSMLFYVFAGHITTYDGATFSTLACNLVGSSSIAVTAPGTSGKAQYFKNGVYIGSGVNSITMSVAAVAWSLSQTGATLRSPFSGQLVYPGILTLDELSSLHALSETWKSPSIPADRRYFDTLVQHQEGVEYKGGWDLGDVRNREVVDLSGNGGTGTLVGKPTPVVTEVGRALRNFDGPDAVEIASFAIDDNITMETLVRVRSSGGGAGGRIYQFGIAGYFAFTGAPVSIFVWDLPGVTGTAFQAALPEVKEDVWMHVVASRRRSDGLVRIYINGELAYETNGGTEAYSISAALRLLNLTTIRAFDGDCKFVRFWERFMEPGEVAARYAPIARKLMYEETFEFVPPTISNLTSGQIPGTDYTIESGTWKITEGEVDGRWRKWLECVVAGIIWRPNPFAHGSFGWEWRKSSAGGNVMDFAFISDVRGGFAAMQNGYFLRYDHQETIALDEYDAGAISVKAKSAASYLPDDTNYEFFVTRTTAGVFTVYVKGGTFTDWTVADMSAIGSNPTAPDTTTNTSTYASHEMDAGDRLYLDRQHAGSFAP